MIRLRTVEFIQHTMLKEQNLVKFVDK